MQISFFYTAPRTPRIRRPTSRRGYLVNKMPTPLHVSVGIDLRILAYRELTIYCLATGFPTPVITWEKNGYPFEKDEDIRLSPDGGKLMFRKLVPSQNGVYTCVASNAAGQDRRRTSVISRCKYCFRCYCKNRSLDGWLWHRILGPLSLKIVSFYLSVQISKLQ